jgi:hypothetical protein
MKRYQLEVSEKQLEAISEAVEFYSRFLAGQVEIPASIRAKLIEMDKQKPKTKKSKDDYLPNQGLFTAAIGACNFFKSQMFPELHEIESYGLGQKIDGNSEKLIALTYDLYRPILEEFAKNKKDYSVYKTKGLRYSGEPEMKIKVLTSCEKNVKIKKRKTK